MRRNGHSRSAARVWALAISIGTAIAIASACSLTTDLSGFSSGSVGDGGGGSSSSGAGSDGPFSPEASLPDATKAEAGITGGVIVAKGLNVPWVGGGAQQHHAVFAEGAGTWAVFYLSASAPTKISNKVTNDFVGFVDGDEITIPIAHNGDGRDFDVAYARIAADDVFHVGISVGGEHNRHHYQARGSASAKGFSAPVEICNNTTDNVGALEPEGTTLLILSSGKVITTTGFNTGQPGHAGNFCTFISQNPDVGGPTWESDQQPFVEVEISPAAVNARSLTPLPSGAMGVWEKGDKEPQPSALSWATLDAETWGPARDLDLPPASFDVADWSVAVSNGSPNVMRWANGNYVHRVFNGTAWTPGPQVPAAAHAQGQGLVLLDDNGTLAAFALTSQTHEVRRTRLTNNAWSPWENITPPDPNRHELSGSSGNKTIVLLWSVQNADSSRDLVLMHVP